MSAPRASGALAAFFFVFSYSGCSSEPAPPPAPPPKAIVGGTLIDGSPRPPQTNAAVVVENGKVVAAGPAASVTIPANAIKTNATGLYVTPGRGGLVLGYGADADIFLLSGNPLDNPSLLASPVRQMKAGEWTDVAKN